MYHLFIFIRPFLIVFTVRRILPCILQDLFEIHLRCLLLLFQRTWIQLRQHSHCILTDCKKNIFLSRPHDLQILIRRNPGSLHDLYIGRVDLLFLKAGNIACCSIGQQ